MQIKYFSVAAFLLISLHSKAVALVVYLFFLEAFIGFPQETNYKFYDLL